MNPPRFVWPIIWIIGITASIDKLSNFYDALTVKPIFTFLAGFGAIIYFVWLASIKQSKDHWRYPKLRKLFLTAALLTLLLLVIPSSADIYGNHIYPNFIEPRVIDNSLCNYLLHYEKTNNIRQTSNSKYLTDLIKVSDYIYDGEIKEAQSLLNQTSTEYTANIPILNSYANLQGAIIFKELGNYQEAITILDKIIDESKYAIKPSWNLMYAMALNSKAITLKRINAGTPNSEYIVLFDEAIEIARNFQNPNLEAVFMLNKVSALSQIAQASGSVKNWRSWLNQSDQYLDFVKDLDIEKYATSLLHQLNGLRGWYSQLKIDVYITEDTELENRLSLIQEVLDIHDLRKGEFDNICTTYTIDPLTRRLGFLNSVLFDYFTREPRATSEIEHVISSMEEYEPDENEETHRASILWFQVKGLLLNEIGDYEGAMENLNFAMNLWHEQKNVLKECELSHDLLMTYIASNQRDIAFYELLIRYIGLNLQKTEFDINDVERQRLVIALSDLKGQEFGFPESLEAWFVNNTRKCN